MTIEEYNIAVRQWAPHLLRFAIKSCNDSDIAKDIVQDAYESLWKKREFVDFLKVKQYLFTTIYRKSVDNFREKKGIIDDESANLSIPEGHSHENAYSDKETLAMAMQRLNDISRNLILLRDLEGYEYGEIEKITGLNNVQLRVYLFRARKALKEEILKLEVQWKR